MIPLRDENPAVARPGVTYLLVLTCVAVFLYMVSLGSPERIEEFVFAYGVIPAEITGARGAALAHYPTVVTSMFLHGGWAHLLGNMLYLWVFGDNVEDAIGHAGYLVFYLLSGIAAVIAHTLTDPRSSVPLIGASGAIAGVLGAYLVLYPRARILALVPLGFYLRLAAVPAWFFLPLWFLTQFLYGVATLGAEAVGVAWWAHIGGFVTGVVLAPLFARRRRPTDPGW